MYSNILVFLSLFVFSVYSKVLPLPSFMKQCHTKDPDFDKCTLQHGKDALPSLVKGDRKYGIPVLAPLVLPSVALNADEQLKLTLIDLHIYNLDKVDIQKIKIDTKNKKISLQLYFDYVEVTGKYDVNGRILILPIQGNGDLNVTAAGMTVFYGFDYKVETRGGIGYMSPIAPTADFTIKKAYFHLGNLFNGNDELGESTNKVLNQESDKFVEAIKPSISRLIVEVANSIVNAIASKVPLNQFFPE